MQHLPYIAILVFYRTIWIDEEMLLWHIDCAYIQSIKADQWITHVQRPRVHYLLHVSLPIVFIRLIIVIIKTTNVTWSRKMSHLSNKFNFYFLTSLSHNLKNASFWCKPHYNWISDSKVMKDLSMPKKKEQKKRNLTTVLANISKTTSPTSDSFLLIMSQMS